MFSSYHLFVPHALDRSVWLISRIARDIYAHADRFSFHSEKTVELPSVSTPYRCFEVAELIEISNTDSISHDLDLTISNHRLADRLGGVQRSPLICIFLRASHGLLLLIPRMSDLPCRLREQPIAVFSALHLALRGARMSDSPYQL